MALALYSPKRTHDSLFLANYANINITDQLLRVPGAGQVLLFGATDYSMRIWIRPQVLAKLGLTVSDLVAALKESITECDAAYESLTDANAGEMIKTARGQRTKLGALVGNTTHSNEEYGYLSVYLRLKGVVPPSSEPRP